jgi:aspartyl-tRNA(Asn)/glutamyl-tRNA(Gln) amidotransferase subunit C
MTINFKDIKKLAELSAIKINNNKKYKIKILFELNQILKILNKINKTNTENINPLFHPIKKYQSLNKDKIELITYNKKIKKLNTINIKNNFYIVPKIINKL